ncbi:tetratricopeptide repeat protein [Aquabacterium sp. OR-4]|uniref:tetratricopeptide repeat protein n=1 Tax=Aquabacterium sp. OR-4 TaxID=2978127 RepID=UPI0021B1DE35|nr:tetratricopeptide repeat protein [Aquabacterium sp. OR-4]MDT7835294.1 tetratricopeptide repeat protein [Aquabacterium sp. OR-4]
MPLLAALLSPAAQATEGPADARAIEQQYRHGDPAQALQRLNTALAARPGDAALRFLQGVLLAEGGQSSQAAATFERLTQEFPDLPEPHNNLAVLHAAAGRLDAARAALETALQLDPAYRAAHENLGDVYVRLAARAYAAAADAARPEPALQRKLQLARDLARSLPAAAGQPR